MVFITIRSNNSNYNDDDDGDDDNDANGAISLGSAHLQGSNDLACG